MLRSLPHSLDLALPVALLPSHLRLDASFHLAQSVRLASLERQRVLDERHSRQRLASAAGDRQHRADDRRRRRRRQVAAGLLGARRRRRRRGRRVKPVTVDFGHRDRSRRSRDFYTAQMSDAEVKPVLNFRPVTPPGQWTLLKFPLTFYMKTKSTVREYNSPQKRNVFWRQHLATLATPTIRSIKCKQSPVYGVFWSLLTHPSTDRNETRTWFALFP